MEADWLIGGRGIPGNELTLVVTEINKIQATSFIVDTFGAANSKSP